MGNSPDCSTRTEGFGTKARSQWYSEMGDFSTTFPSGPGKVWRRYKRVEKTINTTHWTRKRGLLNRYIFLTQIQKLSVYLSQCKSQKMIFCLMHYYLYISAIQRGQIRRQKEEAETCTKKGLPRGKSSRDKLSTTHGLLLHRKKKLHNKPLPRQLLPCQSTAQTLVEKIIFQSKNYQVYLSQCKSQKMIFVYALLYLHFSPTTWTN